jgi:hypothetical protein
MKVVVNRAVGRSFCLSAKAIERLVERKSRAGNKPCVFSTSQEEKSGESTATEWIRDIERNDLDLVLVVEELGPEAAASEAELLVVEIDDTTSWHISDVVGYEFVVADGNVH